MSLLFDIFVYINNVYWLFFFLIKVWVQKVPTLDWIPGSAIGDDREFH